MSRGLTKKQQIFIKEYNRTGNGTKSALKAYDTDNLTARSIASENLTKPHIAEKILSIAQRIPDDLLLQVHLDGLSATTGEKEKEKPDIGMRHKYLETGYKLKHLYDDDKSTNITVNIDTRSQSAILLGEEFEKKLKESLNAKE